VKRVGWSERHDFRETRSPHHPPSHASTDTHTTRKRLLCWRLCHTSPPLHVKAKKVVGWLALAFGGGKGGAGDRGCFAYGFICFGSTQTRPISRSRSIRPHTPPFPTQANPTMAVKHTALAVLVLLGVAAAAAALDPADRAARMVWRGGPYFFLPFSLAQNQKPTKYNIAIAHPHSWGLYVCVSHPSASVCSEPFRTRTRAPPPLKRKKT
jgi:hypothetical protein